MQCNGNVKGHDVLGDAVRVMPLLQLRFDYDAT